MSGRPRLSLFLTLVLLAPADPGASDAGVLAPISADALDVTLGALEARSEGYLVESPKMRAVAPGRASDVAELSFTYLGPTRDEAPLASGELRRQVGLKLRAQDSCNVLYVMWRIAPVPSLIVSVKENRGRSRHAECGTHGYRNVLPRWKAPVSLLVPGDSHRLRAEADGLELRVSVDGRPVWEGRVFDQAPSFDGPVGVRTDNGRFLLQLKAGGPTRKPPAR